MRLAFMSRMNRFRPTSSPLPGEADAAPATRWSTTAVAVIALSFIASACGSAAADDGEQAAADGVATLEDTIVAEVVDGESGDGEAEASPEEAALAFSQCMRDEGIDFPDLGVDAEGNISIREGFEAIDVRDESVRDAREACQDELAAGGFGGGGGRQAAFESPEVQDGLIAFSDCVRNEGFDVGDLTLGQGQGGPGQGQNNGGAQNDGVAADDAEAAADGDGDGPPEGRREGGFGDRNARLATQLDLDPEDPAVVEAIETCSPIIDEAFAAVGFTPGNGNGGGGGN